MPKRIAPICSALFCSILLSFGSVASAQEAAQERAAETAPAETAAAETATAPAETATAETAEATADQAAAESDAIFPVAEELSGPQPGEEYVAETHTDWEIRCIGGEPAQSCRMFQALTDGEGTNVAEVNIVALPANGRARAGVTIITPLGTLLPPGVGIKVDSAQERAYPFSWCTQIGCFARFGFTGAEVDQLKRGAEASVNITAVVQPENPIALKLSLSGFTAAWNSFNTMLGQ